MKVGDKVKFISSRNGFTSGHEYSIIELDNSTLPISVRDDNGFIRRIKTSDCELVQEDKLPHELLGLPRLWYIKVNKNDSLWDNFWKRYEEFYNYKWSSKWEYFGFDNHIEPGVNASDDEDYLKKRDAKLITLAERDRCVNKKQSQIKQLSEKYTYTNQVLRSDGVLFTPDEIGGEKVSDIKERYNKDRSLLRKHKDLFGN